MTQRPSGRTGIALPPPQEPRRPRRLGHPEFPGRPRRRPGAFGLARLAAIGLVLAGVGFLAYTGYRIWDPQARDAQRQMTAKLHTQWQQDRGHPRPVTVRLGQPFALIRIPKFGPHWQFAIVEGTSLRQLADGPGHVPGTALPGTPGNFAVAAHDITAGNPFMHLASLHRGDLVMVQVAGTTYRYSVQSEKVVRYTDTSVIAPVPGHPTARPAGQYITLITCTPVTLSFTPWRIIVTGTLVAASPS